MTTNGTRLGFLAAVVALSASVTDIPTASAQTGPLEQERARAEVERAQADAARARADAETARLQAEKARLDLEISRRQGTSTDAKPGYHQHDGLFLRLTGGFGYGGWSGSGVARDRLGTLTVSDPSRRGLAVSGSFSIGGVIAPDLILHAHLWGSALGPDDGFGNRVDLGVGAIGPGLTWYGPWNLFVTGAVGFAGGGYTIGMHDNDRDGRFAPGIGLTAQVGKEFWVSANWALGIALEADYAYLRNDDIRFDAYGCRVLFTATFN